MSSWDDWTETLWEEKEADVPKKEVSVVEIPKEEISELKSSVPEHAPEVEKLDALISEIDAKKRLPLIQAFPLSIFISVFLIIIFDLAGAKEARPLEQIEIILVTITICLTGILTRSKLQSLLNILVIPIVYFIPSYLGFHNPYEHFGTLGKEKVPILLEAIDTYFSEAKIDTDAITGYTDLGYVLDLIILFLIVLFLGIFSVILTTGYKNDDGEISKLSVIGKPIALFFVFILILAPVA
ncbi:MAG: hypothetical protein ACFFCQ_13185, partial [Promethearchaeota archaeon]